MKHIERLAVMIAVVLLGTTLAVGYERRGDAATPVPPRAATPSTRPDAVPSAPDAGAATQPAGHAPAPLASGRHPRPEEIVRLPRQIQDQVARTVLTPAPLLSPAEILRLPWQIQDQVRQLQQTPTN